MIKLSKCTGSTTKARFQEVVDTLNEIKNRINICHQYKVAIKVKLKTLI